MADQEHLNILKQGVPSWNKWREEHPEIQPDLSDVNLTQLSNANLSHANLSHANLRRTMLAFTNLSGANLSEAVALETILLRANFDRTNLDRTCFSFANLREASFINAILINRVIINGANLSKADLSKCNLSGANFSDCNLSEAILIGTNLVGTNLVGTNLSKADLRGAKLNDANLSWSNLSEANLSEADLTGCSVYAISAWNVELQNTIQTGLIITRLNEGTITVDNLEVAQFIYLLLNNQKIRDVIDTIGQKGVLILGRFSQERKPVLDALREKLRTLNFLPIVFDFECPTERDFTETIMTIAGLSCFIIAEITNPKSSPLELQATVPNYMIPFVPLIQEGEQPFSMFQDLKGKYDWVLDTLVYDTPSNLIKGLERAVIQPALEKRAQLLAKRVEQLRMRHIGEYL